MNITSSEFQNNATIPAKYTCEGEDHNPPLTFSEVPSTAQSLTLIVDDPDAPGGTFTHWVVFDIPPATMQVLENQNPQGGILGKSSFGKEGYGGPCPPSGTHRYFFKLYALDTMLHLPVGSSKEEVEQAMKNHILEKAELVGLYEKKK